MIETVEKFLIKYKIADMPVLMALSGGVDSCVLFDILLKLKDKFNLDLKIIHLNHNWRGEDSAGDLAFVRALSEKNGLECYFETLDSDIKKTELSARDARYAFFERALKKFGANVCFLAHNKNDNVETLIYRIIKGTGVSGLSSIPAVRPPYYRPMLEISRDEIETYAKNNFINYRCDKSNDDTKYKRNFIRTEILPKMQGINENALNSLSSLIKLADEHNKIVDDYINLIEKKVFNGTDKNWFYDRPSIVQDEFLALSEPLQREILSRYFKGILKTRDFRTILKIQNFIKENENSTLSLNWDTFLKVKKNCVFIYRRENSAQKNEDR